MISIRVTAPLSVALGALGAPGWAGEPEDQGGPPTIVVVGRPLSAPPGLEATGPRTLETARLSSVASGRLEDALRDVAGFQQFRRVDSRAANPSTQGITFRGLGGNASARAQVLLDGVPQGDPFAGWIPWSALAPERLAFVRIDRGPGGGPFGSGAVAGSVELESATADDRSLAVGRLLGGSRGSVEAALASTPRLGRGFAALDLRLDRGDGFVLISERQRGSIDIPARYDAWSLGGRLVAPLGQATEVQARALVFRDRRVRGLPGADNLAEGQDGSVRVVHRGTWSVEALVFIQSRNFATVARSADATRTVATTTLDQFRTPADGHGGKIELRPPLGSGVSLRLGADWRFASGETNEFFQFVGGAPARRREAGGRSRLVGAFAEGHLERGPLLVTAGVRFDHWRLSDGRLEERSLATGALLRDLKYPDRARGEISARGGARWRLADGLQLRAAGGTTFRLPTLNELYRPFRVGVDATASNPDLDPERALGWEAGLDWTPAPRMRLSVAGFGARLEGAIANVTLAQGPGVFPQVGFVAAGGAFRQRRNLDALRSQGVEVDAGLGLGILSAELSYALVDARVEASGPAAPLDGRRPAQTPRHQLSATLGVAKPFGDLALTLRHASAQADDDLGERRLPAATTLDASARVRLGRRLALLARAENLLNEEVVSGVSAAGIRDLAQPRTLWAGIGVAW